MRHLPVLFLTITSLGLGACSSDNDNGLVVTGPNGGVVAVDFADTVSWEAGTLFLAANPFDPTVVDINTDVGTVVKAIPTLFSPAGCATATAAANVATLHLSNCSGPFGMTAATGDINLTYTNISNGIQIAATSNNLAVGNGSVSLNTTGQYTEQNGVRQLAIQSNTTGTGPNGNTATRSGSYALSWQPGASCANLTGQLTTPSFTATSWQVCETGCPATGTVTLTDASGATATVKFNGSPNVQFTTSNGNTGTATFDCE